MAESKNYYDILGVSKDASDDEIKSAYRKAAGLKWHPDRWVNGTDAEKKTAEEKFKEASAAYSVLSDHDKRAKYDQFGEAGLGDQGAPDFSGGFGDLNDILNNLFGGSFGGFGGFSGFGGFGGGSSRGQQGQRVFRGRDIRVRVKLTLEEISTGVDKEVTIERNEPCPDCGGKGALNSSDIKTCPCLQRQRPGTACVQQFLRSDSHIHNLLTLPWNRNHSYESMPHLRRRGCGPQTPDRQSPYSCLGVEDGKVMKR